MAKRQNVAPVRKKPKHDLQQNATPQASKGGQSLETHFGANSNVARQNMPRLTSRLSRCWKWQKEFPRVAMTLFEAKYIFGQTPPKISLLGKRINCLQGQVVPAPYLGCDYFSSLCTLISPPASEQFSITGLG